MVLEFKGARRSEERKRQFEHLTRLLNDYRARGLDENLVPNTLCPTTAKTREVWRKWFVERGIGL